MKGKSTERYSNTDITQSFYNSMASQYDKLFLDWQETIHDQAKFMDTVFQDNGFNNQAKEI